MMETLKAYAGIIKAAAIALIVAGLCFAWWYHGHQLFEEGKAEVQALWDADKSERKAAGDQQAKDTLRDNQEKKDALNRTQADLLDTRNNLDVVLKRLRDLKDLPGGEGLLMADGGCSAVSGVADHPVGTGLGIEKRIGSCEASGSDPCFFPREFFDQAVKDAADRKLTREWAIGQKIKTSPREQ